MPTKMLNKKNVSELVLLKGNPRLIKDDKYKKLKESIRTFPEMLELRPLIINKDNEVLGGNMRLIACRELGIKEVPVIYAEGLTKEQEKEFTIKDNVSFGEWDWDIIANEWDNKELQDWGLAVNINSDYYVPVYEPTTNRKELTEEDIQKKAIQLATQMTKEYQTREIICPKCSHEFFVS